MKKIKTLSAAAIFLLSITACRKQDLSNGNNANYLRWFSFKQQYMNTQQSFTANASSSFSITGAQGTRINFPSAAFVDYYDSNRIITGNINLVMQEVNSRKDLVLNGHMTAYTGGPQMIVGGELQDIMASQNGNAIKINPALPAGSIAVNLPSSTGAGAGLSAYYMGSNFTWVNGGAASGNPIYNFSVEKKLLLGMLSSDYSCAKTDIAANAQITVKVNYEDAGYNPAPPVNDLITVVKVIYKDAPSVVSFGGFNYGTSSVSGPVNSGRQATIVAYSGGPLGSGNSTYLYFGTLNVTLQAGQNYILDLKKIDQASLDAILAGI
jgi:hypothetical protein